MKKLVLSLFAVMAMLACTNAENKTATVSENAKESMDTIRLNKPNLDRGDKVMMAFAKRQSVKSCSAKELSLADLSDLLWAANGINRPESGKRTAPSAMNRQDVKVYACMKDGSYLYNPKSHTLDLISRDDVRPAEAPVVLVLVSDLNETWSALDAGIVSQNISIFCAGTGLATYPRATMDEDVLKKSLKLTGSQTLMLCHPVGYFN